MASLSNLGGKIVEIDQQKLNVCEGLSLLYLSINKGAEILIRLKTAKNLNAEKKFLIQLGRMWKA